MHLCIQFQDAIIEYSYKDNTRYMYISYRVFKLRHVAVTFYNSIKNLKIVQF